MQINLQNKFETVQEILLQQILLPKLRNNNEINRFNDIKNQYYDICKKLTSWGERSHLTVNPGYEWNSWAENIGRAFKHGVPISFLSNSLLAKTMVYHRRRGRKAALQRIAKVKDVFGEKVSMQILRENYIGVPMITDANWLTSASTAHHAFHLASYKETTGKLLWESESIIEWGAGYGNMARILRKMNSHLTYTIIDLPELLALQYVYLYSTEGKDAVNIIQPGELAAHSKVNFLPSNVMLNNQLVFEPMGFISTWALTESPYDAQKYIVDSNFFNAENVLLGYERNNNNKIRSHLNGLGLDEKPVPFLPEGHAYACR